MYAIAFDLDTAQLQNVYPNASYQNAYGDIRKVLEPLGFNWQQGSVYFGGSEMNAVKCVLAAQAVSNIRMLRIEELNDLTPAL
jgi:virulence-associated protein VapD